MNYTLSNEEIELYNESKRTDFPKYTSQIINLANQNSQGTRPAVVGQMSELFQEFTKSCEEKTVECWRKWYTERYPRAFETTTDRIYNQLINLKKAVNIIDRQMVKKWVEDLIICKTFNGLYIQKAILASLAAKQNTTDYRSASPEEEAKGIDGYIGNTPYSIKPDTYKTKNALCEIIEVKMIYYSKTKNGLKIEVED